MTTQDSHADTLSLYKKPFFASKISLRSFLSAWEDTTQKATPEYALHNISFFVPLDSLQQKYPTSIYWLKMTLLQAETSDPARVLQFSNLTEVDIYLYQGDSLLTHKRAGAFRPQSQIKEGDNRFYISLPMTPKGTYTLLLRVHHTKGYQPFFDFSLQEKEPFAQEMRKHERADAWTQGAMGIFFLYILLSWLVSRFRPYVWLGLFIAGVGLYSLCSGRYFIDWFFPEHPIIGWLFNGPCLHLGLLGFYLLIVDFWQLPKYNPNIYRFGKVCIGVLLGLSLSGLCINYFTGNFHLTNTLNLWAFIFPFAFVIALLVCCYRRLDRAQKYLYYGILLFAAGGLYITLSSAFFHEQALVTAPYVSNFTALSVFLIFSTGLKEALRQHEIDKWAVLQQLTQLQEQQNNILEKNVSMRTKELQLSNQQLQDQTNLLTQHNATIEILINELSHRVKNNLQLLYSLSSLQIPHVPDEITRQILIGNMARIKAMMVVNQKLDYIEQTNRVHLAPLVAELTGHLQAIYDRPQRVNIFQNIPEEIELHCRQILSLGLILTELITNSFKYAFGLIPQPCISITVTLTDTAHIKLVYADNGTGMAATKMKNDASMGITLVKDLTRQLNAKLTTREEQGLIYTFIIPLSPSFSKGLD